MDDQACPRCKTTKYRNPSLKLMVNVCGHALCESCVDLLFLKGELRLKSDIMLVFILKKLIITCFINLNKLVKLFIYKDIKNV